MREGGEGEREEARKEGRTPMSLKCVDDHECNLKWLWLIGMFCSHKCAKFGPLIPEKITKIVATRCQMQG